MQRFATSWRGFAVGVLQNILFAIICIKLSVKKTLCSKDSTSLLEGHFYMKIIVTMIPTYLVTNVFYLFFGLS